MEMKEDVMSMMYCEDLRRQVYSLRKKLDYLIDRLFTLETKLSTVSDCVCNAEIKRNKRIGNYMN